MLMPLPLEVEDLGPSVRSQRLIEGTLKPEDPQSCALLTLRESEKTEELLQDMDRSKRAGSWRENKCELRTQTNTKTGNKTKRK